MKRRFQKAKAVLCALLVCSAHYWSGCGLSLSPNPDEGIVIPLTADHAVTKALSGTQFVGATAIVVFPSRGLFKLVFPDASREMSGHLSGAPGSHAAAEFTFARDGSSATMQINPVTKQVTNLSASNGFNWRPVTVITTPTSTNDLASFTKANEELVALEAGAVGSDVGPQQPTTPTGPVIPGAPTGGKGLAAFPIGLFFIAGIFSGISGVLILTILFILIVAILNAINGTPMAGDPPNGNPVPDGDGDGNGGGDGNNGQNNQPTSPQFPALTADVLTTAEDTPGAIAVLGNDSDPDGTLAVSTISVTIAPTHGLALADTTTGQITYSPTSDYNGTDTLTYRVCDNGVPQNCSTATVAITVTPVNDAPRVVTPIADQGVPVGGSFSLNVAGVFTDIDAGDSITLSATLAGGAPLPSWVSFTPGSGQFAGMPLFADRGVLSVVVTATDTGNAITTDEFQLNVTPGALFTPDDDVIDFAFVTADSYLAGMQYDALAGNDDVTLPHTQAAATLAGFDPATTFFGNTGNDTIRGGDLNDHIDAGLDDDHVYGSEGSDQLEGGLGIDLLDYSLVIGPVFADLQTITTIKSGGDELGEQAGDQITGFENLRGTNNGGDLLRGSDDANTIEGLEGDDALMGRGGDDTLDGGPGTDRADYVGTPLEYDFLLQGANLRVVDQMSLRDASDLLISIERIGFNGGAFALSIVKGTTGPDSLNGTIDDDLILAFDDDDTIHGSAGADYIFGGPGQNSVDYSLLTDPVTVDLVAGTGAKAGGASGTDTLRVIQDVVGSPQGDSLTGDDVTNTLSGIAGADSINGGPGDDVLIGGLGNDALDGGGDVDRAEYQGPWYEYSFDLNEDLTVAISDSMEERDDTDSLASIERIRFSPTEEYELIAGTAVGDMLDGTTGNDLLLGFATADTLTGGLGDDILQGGAGSDTAVVQGSIAEGLILQYNYSFEHNAVKMADTTPNRDGTDYLIDIEKISFQLSGLYNLRAGTNADDAVTGTSGNDLLLGFDGMDSLFGSNGSDYFLGGGGTNTVDYSTVSGVVFVDLNANYTTEKLFGTFGQDQLHNISNVIGSPFGDTLSGDDTPNVLSGGGGNDNIYGRESGDTLNGDADNDNLFGDVGDDTLNGGTGNDILNGVGGNDTMSGGSGNDIFIIDLAGNAAPGADVISDYEFVGTDAFFFFGVTDFSGDMVINNADIAAITTFADSGADLLITFAGGGSIRLTGHAGLGINSLATFISNGGDVVVSP
ncbi:MAG: putative Ig domain-containing protein [Planctomycetota bacterium]